MMSRNAILICQSDDSRSSCQSDISHWFTFLCSEGGGAWLEEEVIVASSREKIIEAVQMARGAEYSLVIYRGRGEMVKADLPWEEAQLTLDDGSTLSERHLNPGCSRCGLILDCTHGPPIDPRQSESAGRFAGVSKRQNYRSLYDEALTEAESGLMKLWAGDSHESLPECHSFSGYLLELVRRWLPENDGILSYEQVPALVTEDANQRQHLDVRYIGGRRRRHFPLAVGLIT